MQASVVKSTGSWYKVRLENGEYLDCRIKGRLRIAGIKSTNPVAVGDEVRIEIIESGDIREGLITAIEERKNHIVRKAVNLSKRTHVIAANVDQAILIATIAYPKTLPRFIDRFLVTAEAYDVPAIVVFNKVDLYDDSALSDLAYYTAVYQEAGYEVLHTSVLEQIGLEDVKALLANKRSLLSGHSGVGKSSLINAIEPSVNLKVNEISASTVQGQHTTTFAELFPLDFGGEIIDTPGIRGFGLVDMEPSEIGDYFPEIFKLKKDCKFYNCMHLEEPNCAVKQAVENHNLAFTRYESYLSFLKNEEDDEPYRKDEFAD